MPTNPNFSHIYNLTRGLAQPASALRTKVAECTLAPHPSNQILPICLFIKEEEERETRKLLIKR